MSWTSINRSCGHEEQIQIYGTNAHGERDRTAAYEAERDCTDCYQVRIARERREANALAAEQATAQGLPVLTGSPKQIAWAETLRAQAMDKVAAERDEIRRLTSRAAAGAGPTGGFYALMRENSAALDHIEAKLREITNSRWWIDNRGYATNKMVIHIAARDLGVSA